MLGMVSGPGLLLLFFFVFLVKLRGIQLKSRRAAPGQAEAPSLAGSDPEDGQEGAGDENRGVPIHLPHLMSTPLH